MEKHDHEFYQANKEKLQAYSRKYMREWRKKHPEKVKEHNAKQSEYYRAHREEILQKAKLKNQINRKDKYAKLQHYRNRHPERHNAEALAERKVALAEKCQECGSTENLQRHHPNYANPLEILTLCASCHKKIHLSSNSFSKN